MNLSTEATSELHNYRAHRFGIARLSSGEYVLFNPHSQPIAVGPLSQLKPLILTGPEHYDTCIDDFTSRPRFEEVKAGRQLLSQLGLGQKPTPPIARRF